MTLRFDERGKPIGLDWSVCTDDNPRPEVWKTWRAPKQKTAADGVTIEEEQEQKAEAHSRQRTAPAIEARIIRLYRDERKTARECAEATGCSTPTVFKILKRHGVETRGKNDLRAASPEQAAEIARLYVDELKSSAQIAAAVGMDQRTVRNTLTRLGIPIRSASESAKLDRARRAGRL